MQRRQYLAGVVAASSLAVAGCGFFDSDGPEAVVTSYINAVDAGDLDRLEALTHEDSPQRPRELFEQAEIDLRKFDFTVEGIEVVDEEIGYSASDYETVEQFEIVETQTRISGELMGEQIEQTQTDQIIVAKNGDGDWKIWEA